MVVKSVWFLYVVPVGIRTFTCSQVSNENERALNLNLITYVSLKVQLQMSSYKFIEFYYSKLIKMMCQENKNKK